MAPTTDPGCLLLVPDVAPGRGLGHLQRSLALGEAWTSAGGDTAVLVPADREQAIARIGEASATAITAPPGAGVAPAQVAASAEGRRWCVLDGYDLGAEHRRAAAAAERVAVVDDHRCVGSTGADLVIDHNPGTTVALYGDSGCPVLAGAPYTMLRAEHADAPCTPAAEDRLVVVMGGAPDPATIDFVAGVLDAVDVPEEAVDVVGMALPRRPAGGYPPIGRDEPLAPVFGRARVALSAAGSTTWELARSGTAAVLVSIAPNQRPVGETAEVEGIARYLGDVDEVTPAAAAAALDALWADRDAAAAMAERGRRLIDGRGAARVVAVLRAASLDLRPARADDERQLWLWANDPGVRAMAFDSRPIAWSDHRRWFAARMDDPATTIYVATDQDGGRWGQVRFDRVADDAVETDVIIDPDHRGRGLGAPLLVAAVTRLRSDDPAVRRLTAFVKDANPASARAFSRAGFADCGSTSGVTTFERTP